MKTNKLKLKFDDLKKIYKFSEIMNNYTGEAKLYSSKKVITSLSLSKLFSVVAGEVVFLELDPIDDEVVKKIKELGIIVK